MADFSYKTTAEFLTGTEVNASIRNNRIYPGLYEDFSEPTIIPALDQYTLYGGTITKFADYAKLYAKGSGSASALRYNHSFNKTDLNHLIYTGYTISSNTHGPMHLQIYENAVLPYDANKGKRRLRFYHRCDVHYGFYLGVMKNDGNEYFWDQGAGLWKTPPSYLFFMHDSKPDISFKFIFKIFLSGINLVFELWNEDETIRWSQASMPRSEILTEGNPLWIILGDIDSMALDADQRIYKIKTELGKASWQTPTLSPSIDQKLLNLSIYLNNGDANNKISKVKIIKTSDGSTLSETTNDIIETKTLYTSDFTNGLEGTEGTDFHILLEFTGADLEITGVEGNYIAGTPTTTGLSLYFEDALGVKYDLTKSGSLYYGKIQLSETKKMKVFVVNQDSSRPAENVLVEAIEHPLEPLGAAQNTYGATSFSLTESGTYTPTITVDIPPDGTKEIWVAWEIAADALPGWAFFAVRATGEYSI